MKNFLIVIEEAVSIFLILGVLLLIPICIFHYRKFGYLRFARAITFYLFLLYSLCALFLVILPLPQLTADFCQVNSPLNPVKLIPFGFLIDIFNWQSLSWRHFNLVSVIKVSVFSQVFLNILLLMPLGFFLRYYLQTSFKKTLIVSIMTTCLFELTQLTAIYGIYPCAYRTFDLDDLILNTLGAIIGYFVVPLFWFLPHLHDQKLVTTQKVTLSKRIVAFTIDWFCANTLSRFIVSIVLEKSMTAHLIWLDIFIYSLWFICIPLLWQGQTMGKKLVFIRLRRINNQPVNLQLLLRRYSLLVFLPIFAETLFNHFLAKSSQNKFLFFHHSTFVFILIGILDFMLLFSFILLRNDRRGIHELLSHTKNVVTTIKR